MSNLVSNLPMKSSRHAWLLVTLLAACAANAPRWEKSGVTDTQMRADSDACRTQARVSAPPAQPPAPPSPSATTRVLTREDELEQQQAEEFQKCMRAKGYSAAR